MQLPFKVTPGGKVADTATPEKLWEYRVKSVLGTATGERLLRPLYGISLGDIEFNTQSIAGEIINREIENAFASSLEDLELDSISVDFDEATSTMNVLVSYYLPDNTLSTATVGVAAINGNNPISEAQ
jgi:phage baseplate assembly protein W